MAPFTFCNVRIIHPARKRVNVQHCHQRLMQKQQNYRSNVVHQVSQMFLQNKCSLLIPSTQSQLVTSDCTTHRKISRSNDIRSSFSKLI